MNPNKFSLKSRIKSFRFAFDGLRSLFKFEHNSRIHILAAGAAIILGIALKLNHYDWVLLIIVIGLVLLTELLNSSIESIADHVNPEWSEFIRRAKDYGAAAVLISAIVAIVAGCLIFIPKLLSLI